MPVRSCEGCCHRQKRHAVCFAYWLWEVSYLSVLPTVFNLTLSVLPTVFNLDCEDSSSVKVISPLNALMVDQIAKLKEHMDVSVLKATRREAKYGSSTDIMQIDVGSVYDEIACPSGIIFAHPEALLEDKKVFQSVY